MMAKGQKRSNREIRKPKAKKQPAIEAPPAVLTRGMLSPISLPKKKK
jgi:hypothetical protein